MRGTVLFVLQEPYIGYVSSVAHALRDEFDADFCSPADWPGRVAAARVVVTIHSTLPMLKRIARLRGKVPTLTLQDGIVESEHLALRRPGKLDRYQPLMTDRICVFGRRSAEAIVRLGNPAESVSITGSPRFDRYDRFAWLPRTGTLLIASANTPYFDEDQRAAYFKLMREVRSAVERLGVAAFYRLSATVRRDMAREPDAAAWQAVGAFDVRGDLGADFMRADAVLTTTSTLALEAMLCGRPTGLLRYGMTSDLRAAWSVSDGDELGEVAADMLATDPSGLTIQQEILDEELLAGNATERVADVIRGMAR